LFGDVPIDQLMAGLTRRYHLPSALRPSSARIEPDEARALVARGALLIDTRRHDDSAPTLEGALRIWPDEIPDRVAAFPRDHPIVLACT
jgi:rhodanese-related sulfurtransferase